MLSIDRMSIYWAYQSSPTVLSSYKVFSVVAGVVQVILTVPISFGVTAWFVSLSDGKKPHASMAFQFLDSAGGFFKTLAVSLSLTIRLVFCTATLIVLPVTLFTVHCFRRAPWELFDQFFYFGHFYYHQREAGYIAMSACILLLGVCALISVCIRYIPVFFVTVQQPSLRTRDIFKASVRLVRGHRLETISFLLSFSGWVLVYSMVFIPVAMAIKGFFSPVYALDVVPLVSTLASLMLEVYVRASTVLYCEYLVDAARLSEKRAHYSVTNLLLDDDPAQEGLTAHPSALPKLEGDLSTFFAQAEHPGLED